MSQSRSEFPTVFIALGSNLGDSVSLIEAAISRLEALSAGPILPSSLWTSSPVDCPPGSPLFVNAVVGIVPRRDEVPETLLGKLQGIERAFGRPPKSVMNEPRLIDLDLITFGSDIRSTSELTLPHPRAHLRRFVLEPLNEVAPDLVFPGQAEPVRRLLQQLKGGESVRKLDGC